MWRLCKFAAVAHVSQAEYGGLLRRSKVDPAVAVAVLKMPQAQHITAGQLCGLFSRAMRDDGSWMIDALLT